MWRRTRSLVNIFKNVLCVFGFTYWTFFKKKKVAWMGKKKSVYSICITVLSVSSSCSYPIQLDFSMACDHIQNPESHSQYFGLKRLILSSKANTVFASYWGFCLATCCHDLTLPSYFSRIKASLIWKSAPFPNKIEIQSLLSLVFVHIALCIPLKTVI